MLANTDEKDLRVTVLSRQPSLFLSEYAEFTNLPWLDFIQGDVQQAHTLPYERQYTHIIHAATDSTIGPQLSPLARYQQIVDGTRNVLDYAVKTNVNRFFFTSSGGVYGKLLPDMQQVNETYMGELDASNPDNTYSIAKREAEHLCALYANQYGLDYVIARYFAFVGEDLPINVHFAVGNFIRDALFKQAITVNGDGSAIRSYLAQEEMAAWTLALLENGQSANIYNIGSDAAISIKSLAHLVGHLIAPEKPVHIVGEPIDGVRSYYVPDITKIKKYHGLAVSVSLENAIVKAANNIKARHIKRYEKEHCI